MAEHYDLVVIGSGPAGVAAARGLVARGERVTVVDAGVQIEPERRALVERMARATPDAWSASTSSRSRRNESWVATSTSATEARAFEGEACLMDGLRGSSYIGRPGGAP